MVVFFCLEKPKFLIYFGHTQIIMKDLTITCPVCNNGIDTTYPVKLWLLM